jgi:Holliday junction resolvase RusA-like endonuclease
VEGRAAIVDALRTAYPTLKPATGEVIVHVLAEVQPSSVVADVDNLLKPILDALAGVAYVNDTQVVECLVRKIPSTERRLRVKIWPLSAV